MRSHEHEHEHSPSLPSSSPLPESESALLFSFSFLFSLLPDPRPCPMLTARARLRSQRKAVGEARRGGLVRSGSRSRFRFRCDAREVRDEDLPGVYARVSRAVRASVLGWMNGRVLSGGAVSWVRRERAVMEVWTVSCQMVG